MSAYVKTQAELDAALKANKPDIIITGGGGWLEVRDSATVTAYGSATVTAYDSATVKVTQFVAVHKHSKRAKATGGVVIDVSAIDLADAAVWLDYHGVKVSGGSVTLYKALPDDMTSGRAYGPPIIWTVGTTLTALDYNARNECGGGLHVSPTTHHATAYLLDATRWVAVRVKVADITPITGGTAKCKVRACKVLREVNRIGVKL